MAAKLVFADSQGQISLITPTCNWWVGAVGNFPGLPTRNSYLSRLAVISLCCRVARPWGMIPASGAL